MSENCWKVEISCYCKKCSTVNYWSQLFNEGIEAEHTKQCDGCDRIIKFTVGVHQNIKEVE